MELSTGTIVVILAVIAGLALAVLLPGWAAVGWAFARRAQRTGRGGGWAFLGGSVVGVVVSGAAAGLTWPVSDTIAGGGALVALVLMSWVACWAVAWLVVRTAPAVQVPAVAPAQVAQEGWGR
jgi:hypothetical protein